MPWPWQKQQAPEPQRSNISPHMRQYLEEIIRASGMQLAPADHDFAVRNLHQQFTDFCEEQLTGNMTPAQQEQYKRIKATGSEQATLGFLAAIYPNLQEVGGVLRQEFKEMVVETLRGS